LPRFRTFPKILAVSAVKVGIVALIAGALGAVAVYVAPSWFPDAASVQANRQDTLYFALMVMSSFIFSLVVVFLVYSMWRFRARSGDEDRDGKPIHGHTKLEIVWTLIPSAIVIGFALYAGIALARNEHRSPDRLVVGVQARQFAWSFIYNDHGTKRASNVLVLPLGQEAQFNVTSRLHDVIHSFYVPEFRVKADAVPGLMNHTYATPTRLGHYVVECAELCGIGHSLMRAPVEVVTPQQFEQWLPKQPAVQKQGGTA
jgi:cytochrome c oxidase subunit 2